MNFIDYTNKKTITLKSGEKIDLTVYDEICQRVDDLLLVCWYMYDEDTMDRVIERNVLLDDIVSCTE